MKSVFYNRIQLKKIYTLRKMRLKFQDIDINVKYEINEKGIEFIEFVN